MNRLNLFLFLLLFPLLFSSCNSLPSRESPGPEPDSSFRVAFLTDIHITWDSAAVKGFDTTIRSALSHHPDFILTGGDLIMDALAQTEQHADSLYRLYKLMTDTITVPLYNTMGNHEVFGVDPASGVPDDHPLYAEKMYESKIGKRYYSFDHQGWHFIVLDGIEEPENETYEGFVDSEQLEWLRADLKRLNPETPVVVAVHIPLLTAYPAYDHGPGYVPSPKTAIVNAREVLDCFEDYNLKLVLQGHLHRLEVLYVDGITFITSGAVSGAWWHGPYMDTPPGWLLIEFAGDEFEWSYIPLETAEMN